MSAKSDTWHTFEVEHLDSLPHRAGVYAVFVGGELVYVGQSNDLCVRFRGHNIRCGFDANIKLPWCDVPWATPVYVKVKFSRVLGDWAMWEIRLITRLKPRFNRNYVRLRAA